MAVHFHQTPKKNFPTVSSLKKHIRKEADNAGFKLGNLNYIFLTDNELLEINQTHLQHDDFTDIITFDLSEIQGLIEGDVFISFERVLENARLLNVPPDQEYLRVIGHGLLHLMGFKDKKNEEIAAMRNAENNFIKNFFTI